jgi:hypothetical protein
VTVAANVDIPAADRGDPFINGISLHGLVPSLTLFPGYREVLFTFVSVEPLSCGRYHLASRDRACSSAATYGTVQRGASIQVGEDRTMRSSADLYYMSLDEYRRRAARFEERGLHIWPDAFRYRLSNGKRAYLASAQVQDCAGYVYDVPQCVLRFYESKGDARMVACIATLLALENGYRPRSS